MTPQEIRDAIGADTSLQALAQSGDTQGIADALTGTTTGTVAAHYGIGMVLEALGPVDGATVLETLDSMRTSNAAIKWAMYLVERGDLNFGSTATRAMIDQLTAQGAWSDAIGTALKSIGEQPVVVTEFQVRKAIYADNGEVLV